MGKSNEGSKKRQDEYKTAVEKQWHLRFTQDKMIQKDRIVESSSEEDEGEIKEKASTDIYTIDENIKGSDDDFSDDDIEIQPAKRLGHLKKEKTDYFATLPSFE